MSISLYLLDLVDKVVFDDGEKQDHRFRKYGDEGRADRSAF